MYPIFQAIISSKNVQLKKSLYYMRLGNDAKRVP